MINKTSERLKARNFFVCRYFSFYEQLKFRAQLSQARKQFYNLRRSAMDAASQLPGRGPTDVDDALGPACKSKI